MLAHAGAEAAILANEFEHRALAKIVDAAPDTLAEKRPGAFGQTRYGMAQNVAEIIHRCIIGSPVRDEKGARKKGGS